MKDKLKTILDSALVLIIFSSIICGLLYLSKVSGCKDSDDYSNESTNDDTDINPRMKQGIDSIYYDDSMYVISTKIDSVYKWHRYTHLKNK
jgi:hypothetical protein